MGKGGSFIAGVLVTAVAGCAAAIAYKMFKEKLDEECLSLIHIQMCIRDSEQALQLTQDKYGAYCKTVARNILINEQDAEECLNTTMLKAWNAIPPAAPKSLLAFLGKIIRNTALDLYEKYNTAKRGGGEVSLALSELEDVISSSNNVEKAMESHLFTEIMNQFLSETPEQQRIIFLKRYLYFNSINEIAKSLAISESKVKSVLFRLRKALKIRLEEEDFLV